MCQIGEPVKPLTTWTPSLRGGAGGVLHLLGGALAHALRVAVAPHVLRQDGLVARVDRVAHGLADQMGADRPAVEAVALEQLALAPRSSRRRPAPRRPRSGRPSRPARGRRSPTRRTCAASSSSGRSAHWPVNSVTGRAIGPPPGSQVGGRCSSATSIEHAGAAVVLDVVAGRPVSTISRSSSSGAADREQRVTSELGRVDQRDAARGDGARGVDHVGQRPPRGREPLVERHARRPT